MTVAYPAVPGLAPSPHYAPVAIVPAGTAWVIVGGQNAVDASGAIVGAGDVRAQAEQVRRNIDAALAAAGSSWADVVRVTVHLVAGADPRTAFAAFAPALAGRAHPPLVGVYVVTALARPELLLEVAVEATTSG